MAFTEADGITEMTSLDPERLDAVGHGANGTDWLLLKALDAEKRDMDPDVGGGVDRDKLPASDFAGKHRSFPIVTPGDVSDAASSIGRAGDDNYSAGRLKANIIRIATRKGPEFVAQLPASWRKKGKKMAKKMPAVHEAADAPETIPAEGLPPETPPSSEVAPLPTDGGGSELGPQDVDPAAAEGQTMENCDHTASKDSEPPKVKTPKVKKAKKKRQMVSHEDKDVAIGKQTIAALRRALGLAETFTQREQSEATAAEKGTEDMTHDELVALIREANGQAKKDRKDAKKSVRKSADAKKIRKLEKRLAEVEAQPARSRPILSGATGKPAVKSVVPSAGSAFKELEDRVQEAVDTGRPARELAARKQLTQAKLFALEGGRVLGTVPSGSKWGPNMTPIITTAHMIADDPSIIGV